MSPALVGFVFGASLVALVVVAAAAIVLAWPVDLPGGQPDDEPQPGQCGKTFRSLLGEKVRCNRPAGHFEACKWLLTRREP